MVDGSDSEVAVRRYGRLEVVIDNDDGALAGISARSAEHYVWGCGCDGWRLVDGDDLAVTEERVPPGASEQWHVHDQARQFFT